MHFQFCLEIINLLVKIEGLRVASRTSAFQIKDAATDIKEIGEKLNVSQVNSIVQPDNILALQSVAAAIRVDDAVFDYAVRIVRATRTWNGVSAGAGPRGGIALVRAARSMALMQGRSFVTPDDIKNMALPSLRHRIALAPELEIEGQSTDQVLARLLEEVEAPRV